MDNKMQTDTPMRPKAQTMAELLPGIQAILSKETVAKLSATKQSTSSTHQTRTKVKNDKPMTIAEIIGSTQQGLTPRKPQQSTSTKSIPWNSSVKVDKTKSLTGDGQMKHSTVRKGLRFQSKPTPAANVGAIAVAAMARKSNRLLAKAGGNGMINISGVYKIPETPVIRKPKQKSMLPCRMAKHVSFESNDDDSFIQREKEINDFESRCDVNIATVPNSKNNNLSDFKKQKEKNLTMINNVIQMLISMKEEQLNYKIPETPVIRKPQQKSMLPCRMAKHVSFESNDDDSFIQREKEINDFESRCDVNIATVPNSKNNNLSDFKKQTIKNLTMINNVIQMLNSMKEDQLEYLKQIDTHEVKETDATTCNNNTVIPIKIEPENVITSVKEEKLSTEDSPVANRPTVIKSKSPSSKIHRKSLCLRKKVFYKSVPNVSENIKTPNKNGDKALNMYMQIKEQITFLNTPSRKPREVPDTPARISHNLQKQLDKLYN